MRSLFVYYKTCHNEAIVNVDSYDTAVTVPSFAPRMVCTVCGANLMYIAANKNFLPHVRLWVIRDLAGQADVAA